MTPLAERITGLIEASGPIGVADYMMLCLFDPAYGYYTTREPFGVDGDFTTAPEISQMFGELVGVWIFRAWQSAGTPSPVGIAEIGPGRGTLMKDVLRTLGKLDPALVRNAQFALIETSPRLTEIQKRTLGGTDTQITWHTGIETLRPAPLILVGNELFDALPIRQYVKTASGWRERVVGLDRDKRLAFMAGPGTPDMALLPPDAANVQDGSIIELAPARMALMETVAHRLADHGGAALFIDYGYAEPGIGNTLQAIRRHEYDDLLAHPGEADLTAHVDFSALATAARSHGLTASTATQRDFLLGMGLIERAGALGANGDEILRDKLRSEVERLAGPSAIGGMGELFKVLEVAALPLRPPLRR
ncbi:MAG: class I SAM-dependent methyltransferase [Hyphomicrobiales bacterium]|nr:class I SAM-dependent methyltransferase [Hyphomicrobiales bacterium]